MCSMMAFDIYIFFIPPCLVFVPLLLSSRNVPFIACTRNDGTYVTRTIRYICAKGPAQISSQLKRELPKDQIDLRSGIPLFFVAIDVRLSNMPAMLSISTLNIS